MMMLLSILFCLDIHTLFCSNSFPVTPQTPTMIVSPLDAIIESTTGVSLTCLTGSSGTTTYQFFKNGLKEVNQLASTYSLDPSTSDSGHWTCTATINTLASDESTAHSMTVVGT